MLAPPVRSPTATVIGSTMTPCYYHCQERGSARVYRTGGNRSGPVPVPAGSGYARFPTGPNSKFEFKFKKMKKSHKILKNTSRCVESNGVKNFQIFVHLAKFACIRSSTKKRKRRTNWPVELLIPRKKY
jgi:hypothetical protein